MRRLPSFAFAFFLLSVSVSTKAAPFHGARESSPSSTRSEQLRPGQWIWSDRPGLAGPKALVVNLTERRVYVYRGGVRIGLATISSGKKGKETPTGVFTILQKDKDHKSNKYDSAPMPYMLRLTWDGVALHAGSVSADSHGCIHLPTEFARLLFENTSVGINVVVSRDAKSSPQLAAGPLSPIDVDTHSEVDFPGLDDGSPWRWRPDREPLGPVLVVISRRDRLLFVYRNGQEIGRSPIGLDDTSKNGTQAYVVDSSYVPMPAGAEGGAPKLPSWIRIGQGGVDTKLLDASARQARLPKEFREQLLSLLEPGTLLVVMDSKVSSQTTDGPYVQLIDAIPSKS